MIFEIVAVAYGVIMTVIAVVFIYRTMQHDTFNQMIAEDLDGAVEYTTSLVKRDLFMGSPEVLMMHNEFVTIRAKLARYRDVIATRSVVENVRNAAKPSANKPVVID
jgi:hypothetical protein